MPESRNANKKSLASWSFIFFLCQWPNPRTWFQLINRPGISIRKINFEEGFAESWKNTFEFIGIHFLDKGFLNACSNRFLIFQIAMRSVYEIA